MKRLTIAIIFAVGCGPTIKPPCYDTCVRKQCGDMPSGLANHCFAEAAITCGTCVVTGEERSAARAPAATWTCSGPVKGCSSKFVNPDRRYQCDNAVGKGISEGSAADAALRDCEEQLDQKHGVYDFICLDTSGLTCKES